MRLAHSRKWSKNLEAREVIYARIQRRRKQPLESPTLAQNCATSTCGIKFEASPKKSEAERRHRETCVVEGKKSDGTVLRKEKIWRRCKIRNTDWSAELFESLRMWQSMGREMMAVPRVTSNADPPEINVGRRQCTWATKENLQH